MADTSGDHKFLWLRNNAIQITLLLIGLIAGYIKLQEKVSLIDSVMAREVQIQTEQLKHEGDSAKHIDPMRDEKRWQLIESRLDRMERTLDRIMERISK